ncbi:MAG: hypothetical protein Q8K66_07360 [Sediminibacterium sp.]|nr:hypothetical protein [Sediminibacterium sp.]MDP3128713.1 hypothetical protein [Sediminibacterium sp.]
MSLQKIEQDFPVELLGLKGLLLIVVISFISIGGFAQKAQINGILKSSTARVVAQASVMLKNPQGRIIGFGISNNEGKYAILLSDSVHRNSLVIEVNCLGYKKMQQPLVDGKNTYHFFMEETIVELKEVQVNSKPLVKSSNDTLSYDVTAFLRKGDRNIGDVIKHMPGISVAENGEIAYNGKKIFNLYIHGDDLMDGRYGLATKAITPDMIKSVDVLQNFQPIKVLKNKVFTDDIAMNLVLKNENSLKLAGQAMLGGGLPQQFDVALNTMILSKKIKMLNSLKANNSGIDYKNDFNQFGSASFLYNIDNSHPNALLSTATVGSPDIPRQNYYLNKSGVINANNLFNTRDNLQLKSNIQLYLDRNSFTYNSKVDNYIVGDTIHYNQWQNALRKPFLLNSSFTAEVNKSNYYIINKFSLNFRSDNDYSYQNFNGNAFDQRLTGHTQDFSNDFNRISILKNKNILSLRWYVNYFSSPQRLNAGVGLIRDILNNNQTYATTSQYAATPSLFSNISTTYSIGGEQQIRQTYEAGMINEWQKLNSVLSLTQLDGSISAYKGDAGNALKWQRNKAYINATYSLMKESWQASISLPLFWQSIRYYQNTYSLDQLYNRVFLNPSASLRLYTSREDYLSASYSYNNKMGNIAGVYKGLILTNYRSLNANDADLQEKYTSGTGFTYHFRRSIILLFMNAGLKYNKVTANSILSSILTNNVQRTILVPYENDQSSIIANAEISKYIFTLKTKMSLSTFWSRGFYDQFINSQKLPFTNDAFTLSVGIDGKFLDDFTFNYLSNGNWNTSRQSNVTGTGPVPENKTKRFDHSFALGYSPTGRFFLNIKGRQIYSTQANVTDINYLFLDINFRYKLRGLHTDLEFDFTNLFNVKEYTIFSLSSNQFSVNSYSIRGRMGIVRATFNL